MDCAISSYRPHLLTTYNLNEENKSIAIDRSSNGMDAIIVNNPTWVNSVVALHCENQPSEVLEVSKFQLETYPNPIIAELHLNIVLNDKKYCIYDIMGKLILNGTINGDIIYETESLIPGNYILEIEANGHFIRKKIIAF